MDNGINTHHDLFITINLLSSKHLLDLHSLVMRHKYVYSLLWVTCGEAEHPGGQSYLDTLDN